MSCSWFFIIIYKYYFGSALTSGRPRPSDKGGPGLLDPEIRWVRGDDLKKNCFGFSVWFKNKGGGGRVPEAPPLDPPLLTTP